MGGSKNLAENLEGMEAKRERTRRSILLVQKEWKSYAANLEAAQKNLAEGFAELEAKERDLELARKLVTERNKELDLARESLDERLERAREEEKAFLAMRESLMQELEFKFKELDLIAKNYAKEVEIREEKLREQSKLVEEIFQKIDLEKKEIERVKDLVQEKILQLELKEKNQNGEINNCWLTCFMERQKNAELNDQEMIGVPKGKMEEPVNDVISVKKVLIEQELELDLKEHALEVLNQELEFKKKETDLFQELSNKHAKELMYREKQLDSREKQIESVTKFTQDCFRAYRSGKKECRLKMEFLEKEAKKLEERRNKLEDRIKEVELREKELDFIEQQCRDFLNARLNAGIVEKVIDKGGVNTSYADLRFVVTMDGKGLQTFLNDHTNALDTMVEEVFKALHLSLDPAKLVLDAMEGFYPPHLRKGSMEFDTTVVRRSCILILEQLFKISPNIQPRVRDEAKKIATEWKTKLRADNILEVLGFLQLLASYKLAAVFDAEEITILLGSLAHYQQTPELCRRLGFANRDIIQILLRNGCYVEAVNFVYAFELVGHFPPVPILRRYLECVEENANVLLKKDPISPKAQKDAMELSITAMRAVIKCIQDHKLESEYSPRTLEECIDQLLAKKEKNGFTVLESQNMPKTESKDVVDQISSQGAMFPSKALSAAPNSSKCNVDPPQPMTIILANMKGKELLFFLKQHIDEHGLLIDHISSALKLLNDAAGLVLDAIRGLYNSMHKEENEDEATRKWKSCILLLEQLKMRSVDIREEMIGEAGKLAVALKERIETGIKSPTVVIGFLLFTNMYRVNPFLDDNELLSFYASGSSHRMVVRSCQALGISERKPESNLPQCIAEVLQPLAENLAVNNGIDSTTSMVPKLAAKSFAHVGNTKEREDTSIPGTIPALICKSQDPASLVLDSVMNCYHSTRGKHDRVEVVAKSFFKLLQQLTRVSPEIKPRVRDKAKRFSFDWKANWSLHLSGRASSWEALAFLQFIACYKLTFSFNEDELRSLTEAACVPKEAISLFKSLGLTDKIPIFISKLIADKQWLLALTFICEFKLVDKFPPVPLLKNHILCGRKSAKKRCAKGHNTVEAQESAILVEISAIKGAVRCIQKFGLDKEFPPDELIKQISKLQEKRMSLKSSAPLRPPRSKQRQLVAAPVPLSAAESPEEATRKRSALAAGITTQPTQPSPASLPARNVKGIQPPLHTKFPRL